MSTAKHKSHANEFSDDIEKLGDDVGRIKDDLVEVATDVAHAAASGVASAKKGVSEGVEAARERGDEVIKSLTAHIEENPWTSIAVAAGAGILLGMLLSRKD